MSVNELKKYKKLSFVKCELKKPDSYLFMN